MCVSVCMRKLYWMKDKTKCVFCIACFIRPFVPCQTGTSSGYLSNICLNMQSGMSLPTGLSSPLTRCLTLHLMSAGRCVTAELIDISSWQMNMPPRCALLSTSVSALCPLVWSDSGLRNQAVTFQNGSNQDGETLWLCYCSNFFLCLSCLCITLFLYPLHFKER